MSTGRKPVVLVLTDREILTHFDAVLDAYEAHPKLGELVAAADDDPCATTVQALADALAAEVGDEGHADVMFLDGMAAWLDGIGGSDLLARGDQAAALATGTPALDGEPVRPSADEERLGSATTRVLHLRTASVCGAARP